MNSGKGYSESPMPASRWPVIDVMILGSGRPTIHGLLEVDVTEARRRIHSHRDRTGEALSFTAFLAFCLAQALREHPGAQAHRGGRRLVLFDDVDINVLVEREADGVRFAIPYVVRAANQKTLAEIHAEIRAVQQSSQRPQTAARQFDWYGLIPGFVRRLAWRVMRANPHRWKRLAGTVAITSVGMFGSSGGWGIPVAFYNLSLTVGGITRKPGVVDDRIEIREYLSLTISFDHSVVDGAPATRFARLLCDLITTGKGLPAA